MIYNSRQKIRYFQDSILGPYILVYNFTCFVIRKPIKKSEYVQNMS